MASAFNLTAELNLRGPNNLNQVIGDIRRQLSTVSLDLRIDPRASNNIRTITSNVNNLSLALRNAQSNASALDSALRNLGSGINTASRNINTLNNNLNTSQTTINNIRNRSREATTEIESFGRQAGLAVRRFAAFSLVTGAIYGFSRALSSAYSEFMNFNKEMVRLQQVTSSTSSGLKSLSQEITRLSQGFGVSSQSLLQVSVTLAQAGLSATETKKALEALAKSALAPSFDDLNSTVEGSIALMRQFGISAEDLESALGSINSVAAKFAVEAGDIITAIQRTGGVFAAASKGVSEGKDALNEFIAVFTSVRATTRESAETIATGLRTIFTRIQRGQTIQALKEYGVALTDLQGKFVGPYEAVRRLSEGLSKLDPRDIRFSRIVEELGGFRQIGKVIPLIQQFATAQQALGVAQRGSASLTQDAAVAQQSLAVRITKVREEFIALVRDIGQSQGFQRFIDISLQLSSALISIADAAKGVLPALTAVLAIRGISNIGGFVSGFSQSLAGRTANTRGGRRFASGGFVPGHGNSDTVPAMLTPGEFVIRKKAVEAIGVDRLHKINKYASGGLVQKFAQKGPPKLNSGLVQQIDKAGGAENLIRQGMMTQDGGYQFGLVALRSGTKAGSRKEPFTIGDKSGIIHVGVLSNQNNLNKIVEKNITSKLRQSIVESSKTIGKELKVRGAVQTLSEVKQVLGGATLSSAVGSIFEASLQMLGAPYVDKIESIKSMDFPFGMGPDLGSKFGIPGNAPTDATRTIGGSGKGISDFKLQIGRFLNAVENKEFTKALSPTSVVAEKMINKGSYTPEQAEKINSVLEKYTIMARVGRKMTKPIKDQLKKGLTGNKQAEDELIALGLFAAGGSVKDTVPALLTPGEFVINQRAAKRIGLSGLNKLNKADKIQGYNSGGLVGGVQSFAIGGAVGSVFTGLQRAVTSLTSQFNNLNRSLNTYGGLRDRARTLRDSGIDREKRRNIITRERGIARAGTDPLTLLFGAGVVGDMASRAGAPAIGAGIAGAASGAAIGQTISAAVGLTGPFGQLAAIIPAVISGYYEWINANRELIVQQNQKNIEVQSSTLDSAFARLEKTISNTKDSFSEIQYVVGNLIQSSTNISAIKTEQATPGNFMKGIGFFLDTLLGGLSLGFAPSTGIGKMGKAETFALGSELYGASKVSSEAAQKAIQETTRRSGVSAAQAMQMYGGADINNLRRQIAIAQGGTRVTELEARRTAIATDRTMGATEKSRKLAQLDQQIQITIDNFVKEFTNYVDAQNKLKIVTSTATKSIDMFADTIKNFSAGVSRASAEFYDSMELTDIRIGSRLGDQLAPAAPSKLNENVLDNLRAYSTNEIISTIGSLGQRLGFSSGFTKQATQQVLTQKTLETSIPKIFADLASKQQRGIDITGELKSSLLEALKPLELDGGTLDAIIEDISEKFSKLQVSGANITLEELAKNSEVLNKALQSYKSVTDSLSQAVKAENQVRAELVRRQQDYAKALIQSAEALDKSAQIRSEGDLALRQARGQPVTFETLNTNVDNQIRRLTSTTGIGNLPGSTDPIEIRRRLDRTEEEFARLEEKKRAQGGVLSRRDELRSATLQKEADRLGKALGRLAEDSTKASNALKRVQELRQAQQGRAETLDQLLANRNDPEYLLGFIQDAERFRRIMSGQGSSMDIEGGSRGLNIATRGMTPDEADAARRQFRERSMGILVSEGLDPRLAQRALDLAQKEDERMRAAVDAQQQAVETQAKAVEQIADRIKTGSNILYESIVKAGKDFAVAVGSATRNISSDEIKQSGVGAPPMDDPRWHAKGGVVYAAGGKYVNFKPKGTDTVPAMLTPGEFVVNAKATKKNLGLLKAINSSSKKGYSKGGLVYLAGGGIAEAMENFVEFYNPITGQTEIIPASQAQQRKAEVWEMANYQQRQRLMRDQRKELVEEDRAARQAAFARGETGTTLDPRARERARANVVAASRRAVQTQQTLRDTRDDDPIDAAETSRRKRRDAADRAARLARNAVDPMGAGEAGRVARRKKMEDERAAKAAARARETATQEDKAFDQALQKAKKDSDEQQRNNNRRASGTTRGPTLNEKLAQIEARYETRSRETEDAYVKTKKEQAMARYAPGGLEERARADKYARTQTNPFTGKPYTNAAEMSGAEARVRADENRKAKIAPPTMSEADMQILRQSESEFKDVSKRLRNLIAGETQQIENIGNRGRGTPFGGPLGPLVLGLGTLMSGGGPDLVAQKEAKRRISRAEFILEELRQQYNNRSLSASERAESVNNARHSYEILLGYSSSIAASAPGETGVASKKYERSGVQQLQASSAQAANLIGQTAFTLGTLGLGGSAMAGVKLVSGAAFETVLLVAAQRAGIGAATAMIQTAGSQALEAGIIPSDLRGNKSTFDPFSIGLSGVIGGGLGALTALGPAVVAMFKEGNLARQAMKAREILTQYADDMARNAEEAIPSGPPEVPDEAVSDYLTELSKLDPSTAPKPLPEIPNALDPSARAQKEFLDAVADAQARQESARRLAATNKPYSMPDFGDLGRSTQSMTDNEIVAGLDDAFRSGLQNTRAARTTARTTEAAQLDRPATVQDLIDNRIENRVARGVGSFTTQANYPTLGGLQGLIAAGTTSMAVGAIGYGSAYNEKHNNDLQFLLRSNIDSEKLDAAMSDPYVAANLRKEIEKRSLQAIPRATGGLIYASRGKIIPYQPRGTDTVPAMLTPGEFVINRKAAKQNMGLLKAINSGQNVGVQKFNKGGFVKVQYHANNPLVTSSSSSNGGVSSIEIDTTELNSAFGNFQTYVGNFGVEIGRFIEGASRIENLANALNALTNIDLITPSISLGVAATSIKDAASIFEQKIGPFSSSVTELASVISRIPPNITLTTTGSIPVNGTITVVLDGSSTGNLNSENASKVQDSIFNQIALAINRATAGALNILQS